MADGVIIDKFLCITNSNCCDTDIYIFAAQLPSPALLFILCGTFETFLEGNSSTFNLLTKTFFVLKYKCKDQSLHSLNVQKKIANTVEYRLITLLFQA